jgi:transcription-repair coupling factor (superfamily II helicase)
MADASPTTTRILAGGAPEGFDATLVLAELARGEGAVLHVARDDKRAEAMAAALAFFDPGVPVLRFPGWDCLPYDRVSPNPEISAARMATLAALAHGLSGRFVVLTTLNAATQYVPARDLLATSLFTAEVGGRIDDKALRDFLVRMGFVQTPTVTEPGDYAIRGGIVDLWPPGEPTPVRIDLFGDVLDGARRFDPVSQRTTEALKRVELAPVSELILDEAAITRFRQNYRIEFGAAGTDDPLYEAISAGRKHQGAEHWLPFFHERLETLFDYLPGASVTLDDQVTPQRIARWEGIADQYDTRKTALTQKGRLDSVYKPVPPELLYLDEAAWEAGLAGRRVLQFSPLRQPPGPGVIDAGGRTGRDFAPERQSEKLNLFGALADHVRAIRTDRAVVIASWSEGARERLRGLLEDQGLTDTKLIDDARQIAGAGFAGKSGAEKPAFPLPLHLAVWPLEQGFTGAGLAVISEQDVLGDRLVRPRKKTRKAENYLTEAQSLSPGDLVVHVDHGVGRYKGLETVTAMGAPHECLLLEYAGGDRLYLPVENIELLSRYGHEEGLLDRLGGGAWQAKKAKLKERIRQIADKLIRVAAERELRSAPILEPPGDMWEAFCARFPYEETDDQLTAIADVLEDLERGRPMDRLIVGDVGFGKTEVAMRAAFVAAAQGLQVAVIAPTTLLARQHAKTFADRFRGFPVNVRQLSRFVGQKAAADTRKGLADGSVDIVIGTHALLAKGIRFHNLGLLVIDEEQRFGVGHKERLKEMRSDVHVLTLSATPIPRTLQMSLSGVRDLSMIGTPPVDRLAIRTYVSEFDAVTIREALLREHYRGGQSFYVVPRIEDLPEVETFLREQVPEVTFISAHGQMAAGELDDRMVAFYDGKYDVLLATTIVESGIDIPDRQHDGHPPGRHVRARAALPDPGPRGPVEDPRLRLPDDQAARQADPRRRKAAARAGLPRQPRGGLHHREPGPRHPGRGQHRGRGAVGPRARGGLRTLPVHAGGGDRQDPIRRGGGAAGRRRAMVAHDQPRRAGPDSGGVCARPRRAARPLPPALPARDEGGPRGLRGGTHRPLRRTSARGEHAAPCRAHQGHVQARPYREARRRPEGRHGPVPHGQVPKSRRPRGVRAGAEGPREGEG